MRPSKVEIRSTVVADLNENETPGDAVFWFLQALYADDREWRVEAVGSEGIVEFKFHKEGVGD